MKWLLALALLALLALASPAAAQWTRVEEIPATRVFSLRTNGDTLAAGLDTVVYVSTDAGKNWRRSAKPGTGVKSIEAVWIQSHRLYAGTSGQGVFISDDLGASWQAFNQGLVGGLFDSQFDLSDFEVRGNNLYAATLGAGVYERSLIGPSTWHPFGTELEPNQASNVNDLALGGGRLLASAGGNGAVFRRDPGDADWTISNLDNIGIHAGLMAQDAAFTGTGWVVGTAAGVFHSVAGSEPWTRINLRIGSVLQSAFATQGHRLFAAFDVVNAVVIAQSDDDGATWLLLETLPGVFIKDIVVNDDQLYASQTNGLFRRPLGTVSVPLASSPKALRFALAGAQPFRDQARLRFFMPEAGTASIEVFDVLGRRAADRIEEHLSSGPQEIALDAHRLSAGIYAARLTVAGTNEVVRLVHVQ